MQDDFQRKSDEIKEELKKVSSKEDVDKLHKKMIKVSEEGYNDLSKRVVDVIARVQWADDHPFRHELRKIIRRIRRFIKRKKK